MAAICRWCKKEMTVKTCRANTEVDFPDGVALPSSPDHFGEVGDRCHDCNIVNGGFHHPGCDVERCPKCGGQLITCGCLDDEEEEGA